MPPPQEKLEKISIKQTKEALLRSGYLLEHRLETILRTRGYYVEANEAYPDPDTGKSRELDVYAMSALKAGPEELDYIFAVLLVECINNSQPIAFITKEPLLGFLHHQDIWVAGIPVKFLTADGGRSWQSIADYLAMDKYHHYCKGRVATQYCSFVQKKKQPIEWMATHEDIHFDAFRKLAAAVDYYSNKLFEDWRFGGRERVSVEFYYPVLVLQGDLLDIRPTKGALKVVKTDHIQYRMSALDVVTERFFRKYLRLIDGEISKTASLLRRRHKVVRKTMDRIAKGARRLRAPEKIRSAMDF
jgi:hypothetical protein